MKIHLTINGKVIAATLADNRIAEDFVAMLPLTIDLHDFFGREKFGALPTAVSGEGTQSREYEVGDIICWAPGPDVSILYRQDGEPLVGAWHFLGRIDEGVESFNEPGPLRVTIHVPATPAYGDTRCSRADLASGAIASEANGTQHHSPPGASGRSGDRMPLVFDTILCFWCVASTR